MRSREGIDRDSAGVQTELLEIRGRKDKGNIERKITNHNYTHLTND